MERPKGYDCASIPKHTAFLSIITSRKEMDTRFCKVFPWVFYFKNWALLKEREIPQKTVLLLDILIQERAHLFKLSAHPMSQLGLMLELLPMKTTA
jgi:hypothetical protein